MRYYEADIFYQVLQYNSVQLHSVAMLAQEKTKIRKYIPIFLYDRKNVEQHCVLVPHNSHHPEILRDKYLNC